MIRLGAAFICEAVTIHDGLFNALGGGITQIGSSSFPAPFGSQLALMFHLDGTEGRPKYGIEVDFRSPSKQQVLWTFSGELTVNTPNFDLPQTAPVPLNFSFMGLPEPGDYEFVIKVDGEVVGSVPFAAVELEESSDEE